MKKSQLINVYYGLYEIIGEVEAIADALIEIQGCELKRGCIITHLVNLRLHHIDYELNSLYDTDVKILKDFFREWKMKQEKYYQTSIYDYLED